MNRAWIRFFGSCLFGLAAFRPSLAVSGTYREWKAGSDNHAEIRWEAEPGLDLEVEYPNRMAEVQPPECPGHLRLGVLRFGNLGDLPQPVTVRILFRPVGQTDLAPFTLFNPQAGNFSQLGILNDGAVVKPVLHEEVWTGEASVLATFPVFAPLSGGRLADPVVSCGVEILDGRGAVRGRRLLQDAVRLPGRNRLVGLVGQDAQADRLLRSGFGLSELYTRRTMPADPRAYRLAAAAWLDERDWPAPELTPDVLRRLMLMGVWLVGPEETCRRLQAETGCGSNDYPVLTGGLGPGRLDSPGPVLAEERGLQNLSLSLNEAKLPKTELDNVLPLFRTFPRFLFWTAGVMGLFCLVCVVGLIAGFYGLPRRRRLELWLWVPAWALVCGVAGWGLGLVVLDRREQAAVVEYRFAHGDWPEIYGQSVLSAFRFDDRPQAWRLPAGSFLIREPGERGLRTRLFHQESSSMLDVAGAPRGGRVVTEAGWFAKADLPLVWRETPGGPRVEARRAMRQVHVLNGKKWMRLGAMEAGQTLDPLRPGFKTTDDLPGLPCQLAGVLEGRALYRYSPFRRRNPDGDEAAEERPVRRPWVLVGVSDEPPLAWPMDERARVEGRVIWVIQWPRGGAVSGSAAPRTGGEREAAPAAQGEGASR